MEQSNEVIVERLDNLTRDNTKEHAIIIEWLKKSNGDTSKNTKWRHYTTAGIVITDAILVPILITIALKFI